MKKIAIPSQGENISQHFGHCPDFTIVVSDGGKVMKKEIIPNPGHKPNFLPKFLNEQGVDIVLAGGMGSRAVNLFKENGIEVITGASGKTDDILKLYLEDNLKTVDNICQH